LLPIAVTNHIDGFGRSLDDGITRLRGESAIRFGSRRLQSRRNGNDVSFKKIRLTAAIAASAVITVGAVAASISQDHGGLGTDAQSTRSTGATATESDAPTTLSVTEATPAIKGPAPLPSEEQGLPG
jgi:hypothetical protein